MGAGTPEVEAYAGELRWILAEISGTVAGLSPQQLATRPLKTGNSPYAIANHVIGATQAYALGLGCNRPVSRDRPAEFGSMPTTVEDVVERLERLVAEVTEALSALAPQSLDEGLLPSPETWGTGLSHEISRRAALIESIRHAALHLGELRLTRDLVVAAESEVKGADTSAPGSAST